MFDMLFLSLQCILFAIVTPFGWVSVGLLGAAAAAVQRRTESDESDTPDHSTAQWCWELGLLVVLPLGLVIASWLGATPEAGKRDIDTVDYSVMAVLAVQVVLAAWLTWRHRRRWLPTVAISVAATLWCAGAAILAMMALTNNWL